VNILHLIEMYIDRDWKRSANENIFVRCPDPNHEDGSPSCHVSLDKHVFHCFSCGSKGHISKAFEMKGAPRGVIEMLPRRERTIFDTLHHTPKETQTLDENILYAYDNPPQPWIDAGFDPELLAEHGIGFDRLNRRVTVPIRDQQGRLIAISGRNLEGPSKYKVYRTEFGDFMPPGYRPRVHDHLWRGHLISEGDEPLVVVEGFKAALWLVQCGLHDVVALMGAGVSDTQVELLYSYQRPVILMLDQDEAGRAAEKKSAIILYRRGIRVSSATYAKPVKQPDGLTVEEVYTSLTRTRNPIRRTT
jgi:DNA primase